MMTALFWLLLAIGSAIVSTLVRENASTIYTKLAPRLINLACKLLPTEMRAVRGDEWSAEAAAIAETGRPLTALLLSLGTVRGALVIRVSARTRRDSPRASRTRAASSSFIINHALGITRIIGVVSSSFAVGVGLFATLTDINHSAGFILATWLFCSGGALAFALMSVSFHRQARIYQAEYFARRAARLQRTVVDSKAGSADD